MTVFERFTQNPETLAREINIALHCDPAWQYKFLQFLKSDAESEAWDAYEPEEPYSNRLRELVEADRDGRVYVIPREWEQKRAAIEEAFGLPTAQNMGDYDLSTPWDAVSYMGFDLSKYDAVLQAYLDGRCVVLPCKVGDTAYVFSHCENVMVHCDDDYETGTGFRECPFENSCEFEDCDDGNKRIFETTCTGFYLTDGKSDIFFEDLNAEFYLSDFGKTVFLTRAEAEAALKGERHEAD